MRWIRHDGDKNIGQRLADDDGRGKGGVDLSYLGNAQADLLEHAIACTNVGGVRAQLHDQVVSCMMQALCPTDSDGVSGVQCADPADEVESIFDPGSRIGLEKSDGEDYWQYESAGRHERRSLWCRGSNCSTLAKGRGKSDPLRVPSSLI